MIDRVFSTIPAGPRVVALGQVLNYLSDQRPELPLFFDVESTVVSNRVQNVTARWPTSTQAWNAHEWDLK